MIKTLRHTRVAVVAATVMLAWSVCVSQSVAAAGEPASVILLAQSAVPSRDAVVRAVKRRYPGSKVLTVKRKDKGGQSRYRAKVLTKDGKVKMIDIAPGEL